MKNVKKYLKLKMQKIRSVAKIASKNALFITKLTIITFKFFYHFAKVSSLFDATQDLDDASSR